MSNADVTRIGAKQFAPVAVSHWRWWLASLATGYLLFETLTGLAVWMLPFSTLAQFSVLLHTAIGILFLAPVVWYLGRHWWLHRRGNLSHYQLLGYIATLLIAICLASGLVVTWQGMVGPKMNAIWELLHLISGIGLVLFVIVHLLTVIVRKVNRPDVLRQLKSARRVFYTRVLISGGVGCVALSGAWLLLYTEPSQNRSFPDDYNWKFGADRPFAPSMAHLEVANWKENLEQQIAEVVGGQHRDVVLASLSRPPGESQGVFEQIRNCTAGLDLSTEQHVRLEAVMTQAAAELKQQGAIHPESLAGSASCGTSGCHTQIYQEWLPSAHRYAAMDDMFQRVQTLMSEETSPEHTRYCAGCHDPISLFSGAKNSGNITLSSLGVDEGISCLACHCIVQTDVQGNGDYTIELPERYVYERHEGRWAKFVSDFLIRTYPRHHVTSYSRPLYKTAEFCGGCHKQYLDKEVNTDIGKVQGQNQYDSWKNSKWYHEGEPEKMINCRECHMPLQKSDDPAAGDETDYNRVITDGYHRSHRMLASNQYIPKSMNLEGHEEHIALTEQWLRGEIEIPEIADKWTTGPVVRLDIHAPETVIAGEPLLLQVSMNNNKTGHDFPTGPLDMIESWIELIVTDDTGKEIYHTGALNDEDEVSDSLAWFKADGFDRKGETIDRHNLWDLVGASYKRSLFAGVTDNVAVSLQCPSMARGRVIESGEQKHGPGHRSEEFSVPTQGDSAGELTVNAILWYRKANPEFLNRVYGKENQVRSPITEISRDTLRIEVSHGGETSAE